MKTNPEDLMLEVAVNPQVTFAISLNLSLNSML